MTAQVNISGAVDTETVVLSNTTATTLLSIDAPVWVIDVKMACAGSGDTLTLDVYRNSTAYRLHQKAVGANEDYTFAAGFFLDNAQDEALRGTLTTGNATTVRVSYAILNR